ncbi:MAG: transporter substrate-binding domain-containing protein [Spongiibacteraceae bacterium]|nr:transporter substrate-binding domain-containing protein [Spongiibacteraceae bacterium]
MQLLVKIGCVFCLVIASMASLAASPSPRTFQQIIASEHLKVGVSVFSPWVMRAKDGQLIGSELDMARRLASDMGIKPDIKVYEWKNLIPALEKGEIDIIVSGMAVRPDRALRINFSRPYADSGVGMAANKALTAGFKDLSAMKQSGVTIGAVSDTISADIAKRLFSNTTIKTFDDIQSLQQALLNGELHALLASNPQPKFLALRYSEKVDVPLAKPLISFKEAFGIAKGNNEFVNFLDSWVVARKADGWIASTRRYWFESLNWREQVTQ